MNVVLDCVYLITGGSSVLGKGATEALLSKGANLTILDLQAPDESGLVIDYKDKILYLQVDITSEKDVLNAIDATKRKFGKLNGVINCAGICAKASIFDSVTNEPHSLQLFNKILNVNLGGTFNVIRLALPLIMDNNPNSEGERGVIINRSCVLGQHRHSQMLAYSTSMAAISAMTRPMAHELSDFGIRVVDIAPSGPTEDENSSVIQHSDDVSHGKLFLKRACKPGEFGNLIVSIIENATLNGSSLTLNGSGIY